mgnify:CR=1 FL=1
MRTPRDQGPQRAQRTREELLLRLVDLVALGYRDHTGVVICLSDLLEDEAKASSDETWVANLRALPEPT